MMDFKEDKSNISELRDLLGKPCKRRTFRGWIHAGIIESVELRDDGIYVTVNSGVRGARDQQFSIRDCKIEDIKKDDKAALAREAKWVKRRAALEKKEKQKEEAAKEAKALADKFKLIQHLKGQSRNSEV